MGQLTLVDNPRIMHCLVHAERAVNRIKGGYAKEIKELAMEMWRSCMYSSSRADYERRSATTYGDRDTNRIESIEAPPRRTRTSLSIREVQRFAENEAVDSIYLYS